MVKTKTNMATSTVHTFHKAVEGILDSWTALQIAVQQGFGGADSAAKAKWLVEAIVQWMNENADVEPDELEDCIADILNSEFELLLEDNSLQQVSRDICECQRLCKQGKDVSHFFSLPKAPLHRSIQAHCAGNDDSSDDDEDDVDMSAGASAPRAAQTSQQPRQTAATAARQHTSHDTTAAESHRDPDSAVPMEEDGEDEWTVVERRKK